MIYYYYYNDKYYMNIDIIYFNNDISKTHTVKHYFILQHLKPIHIYKAVPFLLLHH